MLLAKCCQQTYLEPGGHKAHCLRGAVRQGMPVLGGEGIWEWQVQKALADFSLKQVMKIS